MEIKDEVLKYLKISEVREVINRLTKAYTEDEPGVEVHLWDDGTVEMYLTSYDEKKVRSLYQYPDEHADADFLNLLEREGIISNLQLGEISVPVGSFEGATFKVETWDYISELSRESDVIKTWVNISKLKFNPKSGRVIYGSVDKTFRKDTNFYGFLKKLAESEDKSVTYDEIATILELELPNKKYSKTMWKKKITSFVKDLKESLGIPKKNENILINDGQSYRVNPI